MQVLNVDSDKLTGFDAYENAWDGVSKQLWSALGFNVFWIAGFFLCLRLAFMSMILTINRVQIQGTYTP